MALTSIEHVAIVRAVHADYNVFKAGSSHVQNHKLAIAEYETPKKQNVKCDKQIGDPANCLFGSSAFVLFPPDKC